MHAAAGGRSFLVLTHCSASLLRGSGSLQTCLQSSTRLLSAKKVKKTSCFQPLPVFFAKLEAATLKTFLGGLRALLCRLPRPSPPPKRPVLHGRSTKKEHFPPAAVRSSCYLPPPPRQQLPMLLKLQEFRCSLNYLEHKSLSCSQAIYIFFFCTAYMVQPSILRHFYCHWIRNPTKAFMSKASKWIVLS